MATMADLIAGDDRHDESETEVPRRTLVSALLARTEYVTTQSLASETELYWETTLATAEEFS
jgi:hypothetical protein